MKVEEHSTLENLGIFNTLRKGSRSAITAQRPTTNGTDRPVGAERADVRGSAADIPTDTPPDLSLDPEALGASRVSHFQSPVLSPRPS